MEKISKNDFVNVMAGIKNEIRTTQYRTMQQVNSNLIMMYFRIGKMLFEGSLDDVHLVDQVATEIKLEFPELRGFSAHNLRSMRMFYCEYREDEKWKQLVSKLSWGHNLILMSKVKDLVVREVYMKAAIENGWSRSRLEEQIRNEYHKRVGAETHNFTRTLAPEDSVLAEQTFKDPYIFDFLTLREKYKEQELERAMVERIRDILLELGKGWSFVGNQYKVTVGKEDYFIDLLFYHTRLKRYIVVELKAGKFEPEFAGKMNFYLSAIDDFVKTPEDNPSIGLILCRQKDGFTAQYSLRNIGSPIGVSAFETGKLLPEDIMEQMPTEEDLNLHIDIEEQ